jgi:undecaprenyl-diphosphatase
MTALSAAKGQRIGLLLAAVSAIAFFALADMAEDQHVPGIDRVVRQQVQAERVPGLERPMRDLSRLGSAYGLVPFNGIVVLWLWARSRRLALLVPLTTLGAVAVEGVSKWAVARPRPNLMAYGSPSGHTLASVVFFGALTYALWTTTQRPLWRGIGTAAGVGMVLGIAYTRLYLDAHWFTDVVGGLLAGMAYLLLVIIAFESWGPRAKRTSSAMSGAGGVR